MASEEYIKAQKIGTRQVRHAVSEGRYPYLPALDDIVGKGDIAGEYPVGMTEVPLKLIAGTKTQDRQNAFSGGYMPILGVNTEFASKWSSLYAAQQREGIRDAVKAYEYLQNFYVQEGNKRVSVMKYLQMPIILTDVTRILPKRTDEKWNRIYYEFCDFYEAAPIYGITFSEEGSYTKLAEAVGRDLSAPWPEEDVYSLKTAFARFSNVFEEKGGARLSMTAGDAFLVFIGIFSLDQILNDSRAMLAKRIEGIWNEFLVETSDEPIALVETPEVIEEAGAKQGVSSLFGLLRPRVYTMDNPLRVAFIYDKDPEISSWLYGHELGRKYLEEHFTGIVRTERYDWRSSDDEIAGAAADAVAAGCGLIVTTSPAQMQGTLRCAINYPETKFMNCSVNLSHNAVRTYYGRMYEAKFLMGALAAQAADNHRIGLLADYPIYGTCANINAFAYGASLIDPEVKVYLFWSSKKDNDWKKGMREAGVSVLSGPDMIKPQESSREYGLFKIDEAGNAINLAAPVWDWGKYYERIVGTILRGTWNARELVRNNRSLNYWWGMQAGVIDVILSKKLPYSSVKLIEILKNGIVSGTLSPFDGELRSQTEIIRAADDAPLTSEEIIKMDWLADNVVGTMPVIGELRDSAKQTVSVSGVDTVW